LDWPAIRLEYGRQLPDAKDEAAAFALMEQMLARLGQSHMVLVPPRKQLVGEPRTSAGTGDGRVPLAARVIDGVAVVVDPALDGHESGIPAGAQLLAVGEHEVAPLLESVADHFQRDVERTFAVRRAIDGWLHCPPKDQQTIRYQALGAKAPKTRKVRCRTIEAERLSLGNLKDVPATVEHRMLPGTSVGYVHFDVWMMPLVPKIEAALAELRGQGMTALVLDLRGNPGGVGTMVVPLGRRLLPEAKSLGVMHMRDGDLTFNVPSVDDPFTGPMALLVDEGTASTSEIFAQAFQDLGRAKVYGAVPSQGAALPSVIEQLPGGGMFQFVVADYKSPAGVLVEGKGVIPDTVVPESREDFAKGRDPVLDQAVADLRGS
ncbi:MAG: hypothetical protein KDK70_36250, partial [Myxococcales bacterium]|nr:hypothetical protein [Myxococcales bacterium]